MQIQMEVCDIDECDFLQTRFKDSSSMEFWSASTMKKGIIAQVFDTVERFTFHYEYMPVTYTQAEEFIMWQQKCLYTWGELVTFLYWKLDEYSCYVVKRDREWFKEKITVITDVWDTIQKERVTGFDHRKPKSKPVSIKSTLEIDSDDITTNSSKIIVVKIP